jgi:hypothetical protein
LTCTGATFWNIRIMFRAPVVTKLVCSNKISLSCYNSLSVMISTRAQPRVQVQSVTILEVLWNITKPLRQTVSLQFLYNTLLTFISFTALCKDFTDRTQHS